MSNGHGRSYDVYNLVPPGGGEKLAHLRVTKLADTLDDKEGLMNWMKRMTALGLVIRPDLLELVAAHTEEDKEALNKITRDAVEAARGSRNANRGTAFHKVLEHLDRGEEREIQPIFAQDVAAYQRALSDHEIRIDPEYVERVCVCGDLPFPVAGTVDRFVWYRDEYHVADVKTGSLFGLKVPIQLAVYAHASSLYDKKTEQHSSPPVLNQERALVFLLSRGSGYCQVKDVDIKTGWRAAQLAADVRILRPQARGLIRDLPLGGAA